MIGTLFLKKAEDKIDSILKHTMFPYVPVMDEYLYLNDEQDSIGHVILFFKGG